MTDLMLHDHWQRLCAAQLARHPEVMEGRMMSAPALTLRGRVYAFFSSKGGRTGLGCRLGRKTPIAALGLRDWQHLAPFKTRPPMQDWIVAGAGDVARWPELAERALSHAQERKD
ncbi:MAG: hypothetical protein AAGE18_06235 [Pseudomonadota bacterium]